MQILKQYQTPVCVFTLYKEGGIEWWVCKKYTAEELFKMSGAEQ